MQKLFPLWEIISTPPLLVQAASLALPCRTARVIKPIISMAPVMQTASVIRVEVFTEEILLTRQNSRGRYQ